MTAASIYGSPPKLLCGGKSARRTRFPWGETGVLGQVTDKSSRGAWRGMGPSTYARVAEITSGRAITQQGPTATCKDRVHKAEAEARGGFWSGAWAHKSDEGGVMPSETTREVVPTRGNTLGGQRSPGHWVANEPGTRGDMTGHRVDGPQPRRHRPPSSLPAAPAVSPCRTVPRIVLWRSPESPLGILEGVSCHRVRILRRSVVVATKVPNPGQRLPNSRPILPTGFLPLALV